MIKQFMITMLVFILASPAYSEVIIKTGHFIVPANSSHTSRFSCNDANGKTIDAEVVFGLRRNAAGAYDANINQLLFKQTSVAKVELTRINKTIAGRTIEAVSGSCHHDGGIRLLLRLWDKHAKNDAGKISGLMITRDSAGKLDVR